jgi:hypothetical protein
LSNWTKESLRIDTDFEIALDACEWIFVYIETWFDIDEKFGTHTKEHDDWWINLYARYNPFKGELVMPYTIVKPDKEESYEYYPNEEDKALVIAMIEEAVWECEGCSPRDYITRN